LREAVEMFAAGNIAITADTLARWAKKGKLQSIRPGRLIYVRRAQIRSLLTPRRRGVPAEQMQSSLFLDWDD
jgi:predicted site-specific integrase-resolvase